MFNRSTTVARKCVTQYGAAQYSTILQRRSDLKVSVFPQRINFGLNILPQGYTYAIERFGKFHRIETPGLKFAVPFIDKIRVVDMREDSIIVDPENAITKDNVCVRLGGNLFIKVEDPEKALYTVVDVYYQAAQLAQSIMRTCVGDLELNKLFAERNLLNVRIKEQITVQASEWGCKIGRFEITNLEPTDKQVLDSMHKQATAKRQQLETEILAEAYKKRQIAEGEGDATKIRLKAEAEKYAVIAKAEADSEGLLKIGRAIEMCGPDAIKLQLTKEYYSTLASMGENGNTFIVPQDLSNIASVVKSIEAVYGRGSQKRTHDYVSKDDTKSRDSHDRCDYEHGHCIP